MKEREREDKGKRRGGGSKNDSVTAHCGARLWWLLLDSIARGNKASIICPRLTRSPFKDCASSWHGRLRIMTKKSTNMLHFPGTHIVWKHEIMARVKLCLLNVYIISAFFISVRTICWEALMALTFQRQHWIRLFHMLLLSFVVVVCFCLFIYRCFFSQRVWHMKPLYGFSMGRRLSVCYFNFNSE